MKWTRGFVTKEQMIEVDRLMEENYGINIYMIMENAGLNLAQLAKNLFLNDQCDGKKILVLAGGGNNGGGVLTAARRLSIWGSDVKIILSKESKLYKGPSSSQLGILQTMGLIKGMGDKSDFLDGDIDLILDGLIGYSLVERPRGRVYDLINWANDSGKQILSLDIPSGIDSSTGEVYQPCIVAKSTMTLALPKTCFLAPGVEKYTGDIYLADISVPPKLYSQLSQPIQIKKVFSGEGFFPISI